MAITFRPHHFLCALCFQGRGYSPAFVANFQTIMDTLNASEGDATPIKIVSHTDSICLPCPNRRNLSCTTQEKIDKLDAAHAEALQLLPGQSITWGEAKEKIAANIPLPTFHRICEGCEWKAYGICEQVIAGYVSTPK